MSIYTCGINHKSAPLALRERLSVAANDLIQPLQELRQQDGIREAALLSTCNRTEIYCASDNDVAPVNWLLQRHGLSQDELYPHLYIYSNRAAVQHAMRVAAGLDSMVLGEPQILGQMKNAFSQAKAVGAVGTLLTRLFENVFSVTKRVRTNTAIGSNPVSVAFAAVNLAKQIFAELHNSSVLLVGAGETIELVAKHCHEHNAKEIIIANRSLTKAELLAEPYGGRALTIGAIPDYLAEVDIVITATASQLPIIGKGAIERVSKARKHRPMLILDLAMPRDVEPEVAELADVYLYNIDDMQGIIDASLKERQLAAEHAEKIIVEQSSHFMRSLRIIDAVDTISRYRKQAERIREKELNNAVKLLSAGVDPEQVLQRFAHRLTNKLIHGPTVQMRQAGYDGQTELVDMLGELFTTKTD